MSVSAAMHLSRYRPRAKALYRRRTHWPSDDWDSTAVRATIRSASADPAIFVQSMRQQSRRWSRCPRQWTPARQKGQRWYVWSWTAVHSPERSPRKSRYPRWISNQCFSHWWQRYGRSSVHHSRWTSVFRPQSDSRSATSRADRLIVVARHSDVATCCCR